MSAEIRILEERYKNRDLKDELRWSSAYTHMGYLSRANSEYLRWLCWAALNRIIELEKDKVKA